jgi:hypothetical protein
MKAALIDATNVVVNVIVWDSSCVAPAGTTPIVLPDDYYVSIGFVYDPTTQTFTDPTAVIPPVEPPVEPSVA